MKVIQPWLLNVGLELAGNKTEAVLISGRKKKETITLTVRNDTIISKSSIHYLGVLLDKRLSFKKHIVYT